MDKMTLADIRPKGRRVFVRADLNVPIKAGKVADETRLAASVPTLRRLMTAGARIILASHLGRPKGKVNPEMSLAPVAARLSALLGREVRLAPDCIGPEVEAMAMSLGDGDILLLENLRFHPEEEANDDAFASKLAALAEIYVNDAFGSAHRAHASTEGITRHLSPAAAGVLMEKELEHLGGLLASPARPFVAILGGAKVSGKLEVIRNLSQRVDRVLIGGGMAFTFLKARGAVVGRSLVEDDLVAVARETLDSAAGSGKEIELPSDVRVVASLEADEAGRIVPVEAMPVDGIGVDIGPRTIESFVRSVGRARTIFWNGPMGIFEKDAFAAGTMALAKAVSGATERGAVSVVGGGDSAAAVARAGVEDRITHVSTGGGASLEFLEGRVLPGVAALTDRAKA